MIHRHADDRFHARESAPLGSGWKRGEQKQAVGRSRGGRNTKIHALADVKGRLIAILLSTGEAHDCPVAGRLVRRIQPSKWMLGDKAYDSTELLEDLHERGTKPVIVQLQQTHLQAALAHRERVQQVEELQAHRPDWSHNRFALHARIAPTQSGGYAVELAERR